MTDWKPIGRVPFTRLAAARVQAHHAVQPLARAARSALAPLAGDGHTNLGWDPGSGALWTRVFPGDVRFGLRLSDLALLADSPERSEAVMVLSGQTPLQAEQWFAARLEEIGAATAGLDDPLPYEVPGGPVRRFAATGDTLTELAAWFEGGHRALTRAAVSHLGLGVEAVRCWPHHFDLGALLPLDEGDPETSRSISIGMSPGDESYDQPYFYVTPWPRPASAALPAAPAGRWHTEGFTSLVLTAEELVASADPGAVAERFLAGAVEVCRRLTA